MFLKSLELSGFKSFASKAVLEFPKGITAIVGPNGSGKSNIIDAIRWIFGERESKNLRGDKIENLIFAGTPKRPRVGMAQVGLVFENGGQNSGKIDFSEISVLRKVSRDSGSGAPSQYFLNKSEARLKDAVDFFAKLKLGTKGLTIINQGSGDLFVRVTPEERRIMIEEVLGLKEYQLKKSEAERKLNNTNINLEKVKAIVEEVLPRLRMLKRQTAKWEKRGILETELKNFENDYFSFKLNEIENENRNFDPQLKEIQEKIFNKNEELKILELEVKKIEEKSDSGEIDSVKSQKAELLSKHLKIQKEFGRLEAKVEILSQPSADLSPTYNYAGDSRGFNSNLSGFNFQNKELLILIDEIKNFLSGSLSLPFEKIILNIQAIIKKIDNFFAVVKNSEENEVAVSKKQREIIDLEKIKNDLLKEISVIEKDIEKIEKIEANITFGLQDFNKQFQKAFEAMENKRKEIGDLENQKQRIIFEKEKLGIKINDLESQINQAGRALGEFQSIEVQLQYNVDLAEIERKMFRLRAELASIGEIDASLAKEAEETEKHYNCLSGQIKDLEKAFDDLKILIKDLKEKIHNEFLSAFHLINEHFNKYFGLMFGGGGAKLRIKKYEVRIANNEESDENKNEDGDDKKPEEQEEKIGVEIDLNLPRKKIASLEMLSGGEKSLVSIAALFALISVSPPPFLVLDEIDAPLDEKNSQRFANLIKEFARQTQFIVVTHNRAVMEVADVLYGITMNDDGTSKLLSLKLDT
ncbi:AAA family ATPase [Candidatus Wolfebacteria bacterium]|nr:AAA family ATPase [Candidatus Wolfebacteria bacterium]